MSKTLDLILANNKGYISEDYGEKVEIFPISELLEKEMIELCNIDIPLYLANQSLIDLSKYNLSSEKFNKIVNKEYTHWLNINHLDHGSENLELFAEDCYLRNLQNNAYELLDEIKNILSEYLAEPFVNIKCCWLSNNKIAEKKMNRLAEYILPDKDNRIVISDMDEEGVLIAFK